MLEKLKSITSMKYNYNEGIIRIRINDDFEHENRLNGYIEKPFGLLNFIIVLVRPS